MRNALPFKVECKSTYPFFETIAAFNCDQPALAYARDCASTNPAYKYRVLKAGKVVATNEFGKWADQ